MTKSAEAKRDELLRTKDRNTNPDVFSPWSFDAGYAAKKAEESEALKVAVEALTKFCDDEGYSKLETSGHYLGQALATIEKLRGK